MNGFGLDWNRVDSLAVIFFRGMVRVERDLWFPWVEGDMGCHRRSSGSDWRRRVGEMALVGREREERWLVEMETGLANGSSS